MCDTDACTNDTAFIASDDNWDNYDRTCFKHVRFYDRDVDWDVRQL